MSVTTSRVPTGTELPLPSAFESLRAQWLYLAISWDDVTVADSSTANGLGNTVQFARTISAHSDFLSEEGVIHAMQFVTLPNTSHHFAVHADYINLHATTLHPLPTFGLGSRFQIRFEESSGSTPQYNYRVNATYHQALLDTHRYTNGYEQIQVTDALGDNLYDTRTYSTSETEGLSTDSDQISLYGRRHNFGPFEPCFSTDAGGVTGTLEVKPSYDVQGVGMMPFPFEKTTPCQVFLEEGFSYGVTSHIDDVDNVSLYGSLPTAPGIVGICVLWERTALTQQGAFWHPSRAFYDARNNAGAVEVGRRATATTPREVLATLPDLKNPSIFQFKSAKSPRRGQHVTGSFGLLAKHTSGQWRLFESKDGGKTWSFMSAPFASTNIDYASPVDAENGVAVAAVIKGTPNKLVFKRTANTGAWQSDADAAVVRNDVPNLPPTLVTAPDGRSDFAILFNGDWIVSPDGGHTWPL